MAELALYVAVAIIAGIVRYMLGLSQACLYVGKAISVTDTGRGLQDAVTPPMASNIALASWAFTALMIGYGFWQFGVWTGAIAIGIFILTGIVLGAAVIPRPNSKHFVRMIYRSLVNRVANYARANDQIRSEAAAMLVADIERLFADKLT